MGILAAYAVPHPPLLIPGVGDDSKLSVQKTKEALEEAARRAAELGPETLVIISPHAPMYADAFHISPGVGASGDFGMFGVSEAAYTAMYDEEFVSLLEELSLEKGISCTTQGQKDTSLDHATMVPLHFFGKALGDAGGAGADYKVVRIGLSGLGFDKHLAFGKAIAQAANALDRKVAVVASGDLSHKLLASGPYGFTPEGPELDEKICAALTEGSAESLMAISPRLADAGAECGLRSFIMMSGALDGLNYTSELLSYEGPLGVGYAVASYQEGALQEAAAPVAEAKEEAALGVVALAAVGAAAVDKAAVDKAAADEAVTEEAVADEAVAEDSADDETVAEEEAVTKDEAVEDEAAEDEEPSEEPSADDEAVAEDETAKEEEAVDDEAAAEVLAPVPDALLEDLYSTPTESLPVGLARKALQAYFDLGNTRPALDTPEIQEFLELYQQEPGLKEEYEDLANRKAGVFVSIHEGQELRGCIGTIAPARESVLAEIIQNAVSAAREDPRFLQVQAYELGDLTVKVDILGEAEQVRDRQELDPKRYGVIVRRGHRRGLLLPDLEGVDTPKKQIEIALAKAGIRGRESYALERFEVVRYT
ncbi:MAG: AmmeMemoRadiSam system protein A [Coriobacteriia bacterium]|nr:AmmeMemoRadiSam system protein A [Coriobacteriia bacterium]MCL2749986.1 AmmeMemoRadiSam system protein A [Coriobacteriia bacterium]